MQSGKKRLINNVDLYSQLKSKTLKSSSSTDQEILVRISQQTLDGIENGPPIEGTSENNNVLIDNLEINIYPQTLEEYDSANLNYLTRYN